MTRGSAPGEPRLGAGGSLENLLDELEAPAPSPCGGSAAAAAAAMAASLVTMVARGSKQWPDGPGIAAQARALRARLMTLADADADAFARVLATMRDDSGTTEQRDFALGDALLEAAEVPLAIAEAAADVADLAALAAGAAAPYLRPDATVAATLAEASVRASAHLVEINLATVRGDRHSTRAAEVAAAAAAARARALGSG